MEYLERVADVKAHMHRGRHSERNNLLQEK